MADRLIEVQDENLDLNHHIQDLVEERSETLRRFQATRVELEAAQLQLPVARAVATSVIIPAQGSRARPIAIEDSPLPVPPPLDSSSFVASSHSSSPYPEEDIVV